MTLTHNSKHSFKPVYLKSVYFSDINKNNLREREKKSALEDNKHTDESREPHLPYVDVSKVGISVTLWWNILLVMARHGFANTSRLVKWYINPRAIFTMEAKQTLCLVTHCIVHNQFPELRASKYLTDDLVDLLKTDLGTVISEKCSGIFAVQPADLVCLTYTGLRLQEGKEPSTWYILTFRFVCL